MGHDGVNEDGRGEPPPHPTGAGNARGANRVVPNERTVMLFAVAAVPGQDAGPKVWL
ncbi:MAG: hypothetical protein QOJ63_3699 [Solirubrobacteraceae bacterium]|jgi:hypothetical protein|nr:hypothetical protein [Solirubrobacteraceae bacterium]